MTQTADNNTNITNNITTNNNNSNDGSRVPLSQEGLELQPHAFHLQLPVHHRTESGVPYITIHAQRKSRAIWRLVKSLELHETLFLDDTAAAAENDVGENGVNGAGGGGGLDDKDDDDIVDSDDEMDDEGEEFDGNLMDGNEGIGGNTSLHALSKKCIRLHTQLTSLYSLKHNGISQFELAQMLLKVLSLLSATVTIEEEEEGEKEEGLSEQVEKMSFDEENKGDDGKKKKKKKVTIKYGDMGSIIGGRFSQTEIEDSMLITLGDGRRVVNNTGVVVSAAATETSGEEDNADSPMEDATTTEAAAVSSSTTATTSTTSKQQLTILISEGNFNYTQAANQKSALQLAIDLSLPYQTIDGMDPNLRTKRNELFDISGVRGNYPQIFLTTKGEGDGEEEVNEFLGDYEWFEYNAHELVGRFSSGSGGGVTDEKKEVPKVPTPIVNDDATPPSFEQAHEQLEEDLSRPFALPNPARQALLSVALLLLAKKGALRSVSNAAIFPKGDDEADSDRWMLLLNWRALLSMLLRTAPYLDEHKAGAPPMEASSMKSKVQKSTVTLIRSCRCFFDQGIRPPGWKGTRDGGDVVERDATARALWKMTENDLLYHTHSNSCFRALIMLYLFHPSKCSSEFYLEVMPKWMESWRNVDRCPEYDFLWMVMFGRARKYIHPKDHDWGSLRKHLLTQCGYWLQIPYGGASSDKSFPRAAQASKRSFPSRLKAFVGSGSKYEEGIDFVGRLTKLLMFCSGPHSTSEARDGHAAESKVSEGTSELLSFLQFVKPYFNPSNTGAWTFALGAFLHYLSYELSHRIGIMAGLKVLESSHPNAFSQLCHDEPYLSCIELPGNEIVAFLDTCLPLCQQALYSKNGSVSHAGETALLYLAQVDPARVAPPMIDFGLRALDISSVNLAHQAPSALSALTRLFQPALRQCPILLLSRLPEMLRLSLAGIDSNDQNKTMRTLIFYRNLAMWFPVGGALNVNSGGTETEGTIQIGEGLMNQRNAVVSSASYKSALASLSESSILAQTNDPMLDSELDTVMQEAMLAMSDWSLAFLDRVYELLRAAGEQEKLGKGHGGVAASHGSVDIAVTKNVSRIMKETLTYFFSSMDTETYNSALRSVSQFMEEETLPFAVKDASLLCQAVCMTRFDLKDSSVDTSPGLDALVPILTEDLEHRSTKSAIYRLRCLAGAVRYAGSSVLKHRDSIAAAITYALSKSDDKVLFKTGCKLLRHTLSSQCEEYPIAQSSHPMRKLNGEATTYVPGACAELKRDGIHWCVPSGESIDFAVALIDEFCLKRMSILGITAGDIQKWRQSLRVLRYTLRGSLGILLDDTADAILSQEGELCPKEKATASLIKKSSPDSQKILGDLRRRLCFNLMDITCLIARKTIDCESKSTENGGEDQSEKKDLGLSISTDAKVCNEVIEISELLLTRRGAQYQSSSSKTIWRGQKEILTDFVLESECDYIQHVLLRADDESQRGSNSHYKDGEDSGKTISRCLLVNRIHLTNQALTATASSQIPRRLKKIRDGAGTNATLPASLFTLDMSMETLRSHLSSEGLPYQDENCTSLRAYEAVIDGLCNLSCHPNINVRGNALSITDFLLTRFGWVVKHRTSRFIAAITLRDEELKGVDGIPSTQALVNQLNSQGKRTRFAEVVKGVLKLAGLPKVMKHIMWNEADRFELVKTVCGTQRLLKLLPPEDVAKVVYYINSIFLLFRSRNFSLLRVSEADQVAHESCLGFLLDMLQDGSKSAVAQEDSVEQNDDADAGEMHWRDRLVASWFLLKFVDEKDLVSTNPELISKVWTTCFKLIEEEVGQPIQRVSLGLLGRLVSLALVDVSQPEASPTQQPDLSLLRDFLTSEKACKALGDALVYDHREDSSVGGGHGAQWSSGVQEIIRDATSNLAPRTLFPFQRVSVKTSIYKLQHSQLLCSALLAIGHENAKAASEYLLAIAKELVASPPSEDQRNQQCTSAEILGGVCRAMLFYCKNPEESETIWETMLLPFLEDAVQKTPTYIMGAFFDACRYGIHHFPPNHFFPLLKFTVLKVQTTLWQRGGDDDTEQGSGVATAMADRFALQSKWLYFIQSVLIELDGEDDVGAASKFPWYTVGLLESKTVPASEGSASKDEIELGQCWTHVSETLIPSLLNAIGHPYDKCRDHIASLLFRMCYCHRKFINTLGYGKETRNTDPGVAIMTQLVGLQDSTLYSFKEKNRALGTARKFVAYCVHWGDAKSEFSQFIVPLLPLAFKSLQTTEGEVSTEDRGIEAELVKGFRYAIADISTSCVAAYGVPEDITRVLSILKDMSEHENWQIRQACAHFLRCFQGVHKFLLSEEQADTVLSIAISLLSDERREVSTAATSALTGILVTMPQSALEELVTKYIKIANKSVKKKKKKVVEAEISKEEAEEKAIKEKQRAKRQQRSVFVLCAVVMGRPYDTPPYIPEALAALSKHSFAQRASLGVREEVKRVCSEFKRTHTDNWEAHKKQFTREQLEALEDVVSTPHYYA